MKKSEVINKKQLQTKDKKISILTEQLMQA